jgi:hypothetical protein
MSKTFAEAKTHESKYWKKKPVQKFDEKVYVSEEICSKNILMKKYGSLNQELPVGYQWDKIELCDQEKMEHVSTFLTVHYKRGTDSSYIIKYDPNMLKWEMNNHGVVLAIRETTTDHIVGMIGVTYRTVQLCDDVMTIAEPMYMCCDEKYKHTGIANILMDEITRHSLALGLDKGVFCTNYIVSKPITTFRQYARSINYKKLKENNFVEIAGVNDDDVHNKMRINLNPNKKYVNAKKSEANIDTVHRLYTQFMSSFNIHIVMNKQEIENYFFDERYVKTYLVLNENAEPVDFISYNFYDIYNTKKSCDNVMRMANILMYSSNEVSPDLLFINILKQLAADKVHNVFITDMMQSSDFILSSLQHADHDTDDEDENAVYDLSISKTGKKYFMNLFNWKMEDLTQNMCSWLIF